MMQSEQTLPASCRLRVLLHGPLQVSERLADGSWRPVAWGQSRIARTVFRRLLTAPGRRLSRGQLADDLWPESDFEAADTSLQGAISLIRSAIGKDLVLTWDGGYEIAGQTRVWMDLDAAETLLKATENEGSTSLAVLPWLEEALSYLERGVYLAEETSVWCYAVRKKSEDLLRQCRLWLAENYERQSKFLQAGLQYRELLQTMPPDERALQRWITMLYQQGKASESLKCYQDVKASVEAQGFTLSETIEQLVASLNELPKRAPFLSGYITEQKLGSIQHSLALPMLADTNALSSQSIATIIPFELFSTLGKPLCMNEETLHLFSALTEVCQHLSEGNELNIAEQVLWAFLPKIELLTRFPSEHQGMAATIASRGYLLAASLVGHRNNLLGRLRCSKQALHYGELAGNLNLQVVAMRQIAISFDCMDRPDKVLETSQQTLPFLKDASPLLQACIHAGVSGAYAELGQKQDASRFMELAYEHFPEHPENEPSYLHTICRYSTLVFFDGLNHLDLGEPAEAEKILARIDGLQPKIQLPERVRIELLNYQIKVFLALRKKEQASTYLEEAANASFAIGSERYFQNAFALYRQMQNLWKHEPEVQQLADLFVR
jgi:DNA-binding SARP family transcriptional activator